MYSSDKPQVKYRRDYQPSQYLIYRTRLSFELGESHTIVSAELDVKRNPEDTRPQLLPLTLDGVDLELMSIKINGQQLKPTEFEATPTQLSINKVSDKFTLSTRVKIEPQKNTSLEGLYTSSGKFCTQCEAEGFRKITYYLDRPDILSEFKVRVEGNKQEYPLLLSNGNPIESGELDDGRHFVTWHDPFPKPCYLFALVAGDLDCLDDSFTTMSGRQVKLQVFVDKGKLDQCQFAMQSLVNSMRWDEQKYGREYDLERYMIVAVGDFNMGAMENKGLNIFNTAYVLANQKTATDDDFEGVERVIGHEYFHNWTGNRITCRDWFQLSLKEGLTVFRDQQFSEDMQSPAVQRIDQVKIIRAAQFAEDSGPMAHPVRPDSYIEMNNFYTVTVYNKGAEVIRMMHTLLGEARFRRGMDMYFERHDGQAVTCEDFIQSMETANSQDWSLFRHWYSQAGTPRLSVRFTKLDDNEYELSCKQFCPVTKGQPAPKPFMIPLKVGFINHNGQTVNFSCDRDKQKTTEELLVITEQEQSFRLFFEPGNSNADDTAIIPSLLRDFSAPVILNYDYTLQELAILFSADPNAFNRWDAGQTLMSRLLLEENAVLDQRALSLLEQALVSLLEDEKLDNALKALAVQLPQLSQLVGQSESVDLDKLFAKYRQLRRFVGESLEHKWFSIYNTTSGDLPGDRQIRNIALAYMMIADDDKHFELAASQQSHADNMTDEIAALKVIANSSEGYKSEYLAEFYDKWQDEELVMDKWFSAQVQNDSEAILDHLSTLMKHAKFSLENPNKVRAVIGAFVAGNLLQFHNATGLGYEFLADTVIRLNTINPQIAAKLAKSFSQWKKLDAKRQALIREQLERIRRTPNLSSDVFEVVDKSLQI